MPRVHDSRPDDRMRPHAAIQSLADQYALPVSEVVRLYQAKLDQLSEHASIKQYLVMLAIKQVDAELRVGKHRH